MNRRLFGQNGSDSTLYARDTEAGNVQQAQQAPPRPLPVGFWHHDLYKVRKHAARKYPQTGMAPSTTKSRVYTYR